MSQLNQQTIGLKEIQKTIRRFQKKPNDWFHEVLAVSPWEKQQDINDLIASFPKVSVRSCHASGKDWDIGRLVLWFISCFPHSVSLTTAPTWRQVEQIMWRNIRTGYRLSKIPLGGEMLTTRWEIDDDWYAIGLSTDEPEAFAGFHSKNILIVVDEASGVSEDVFEAIDGLMAGGNCKLVLIGNPTRTSGSFAKSWKDNTFKHVHISGFDTPNVKAGQVVIPGLMNPNYPQEMKDKWGEDSDVYRVKVLGNPPRSESDALVPLEIVEQSIERVIDESWTKEVKIGGCDVARFGDDITVLLCRQGNKVFQDVRKFSKRDTMEIAGEVIRFMKDNEISPENMKIDVIGLGAGVVDRLIEQGYEVRGVNVATEPTLVDAESASGVPQGYANLRAQAYWTLRQEMKQLQLPRDDAWYQLSNIKYKYNSKGRLLIESKEEMKKRKVASPNEADALMLTYADLIPPAGAVF